MYKQKEEQEMDDTLAESDQAQPDTETTAVAPITNNALANPVAGMNIAGLEDLSASILPIPFVSLVQPSSTKCQLPDGTDAPQGHFYLTDTQKITKELRFVMLKAKESTAQFESGPSKRLNVLGFTIGENPKLIILTLSVMSFSNFGRLISKMKDAKISKCWEYELLATPVQSQNKKGKYYVANLQLENKLDEATAQQMQELSAEYGIALDREDVPEETQ